MLALVSGLSPQVFKGIMKMGFKVPTPVQRKAIPALLSGVDVVAMARTGSGQCEVRAASNMRACAMQCIACVMMLCAAHTESVARL